MGIKLTFEIAFTSNYHIGAGYGKGFNVDSAILREGDGSPVIRGSALVGLLRDGASRLLERKPLQKAYESEPVERLFGSAAHPKRWFISSARPKELLPIGRDSQDAQRVRIDPRTRRAMPRKLFSQEEGLAGQTFSFTAECPEADESALDEAALLVAAARNVRQLGRSRRRGMGECLIRLVDVEGVSESLSNPTWQDWFLARFERVWIHGTPASPLNDKRKKYKVQSPIVPSSWKEPVRFRLIVRLDEPLLIANRAPAGNQFDTRDAIPGSVILGALAERSAAHNDLTNAEVYSQFVSLFLRDNVVFPTLYPAHEISGDIYPSIPAPLGLLTCSVMPFREKSEGHGIYPAVSVDGTEHKCPQCSQRLEPLREYILLKDTWPFTLATDRSSELHIQIDEQSGRVKEGQLYGYTVLNAGQYFVGELICADETSWLLLKEMADIAEETDLHWRLGKARRRGYGKVTAWLERHDDKPSPWVQLPLSERVKSPKEMLSLTLLTDTIIMNSWGQQAAGFDKNWLEEVLGLGELQIEDAYARTRIVDSFKTQLGLPRWRDTALVAGSVVWFRLQAPPDDWKERMEKLEIKGIGLRRNEGFGRIAFNHPVYDQREALTQSDISLDRLMRRREKPQPDKFAEEWNIELDTLLLNKKLREPFVALARWLHAHSSEPPTEILGFFNAKFSRDGKCESINLEKVFGEPDEALIETIGKAEYGDRSKDNFFMGDGKDGMCAACNALKYLSDHYDRRHWAEGIEILADRIAALAGSEKGEAR